MGFSPLDWTVFGGYFAILAFSSWLFSRVNIRSSRDYFVGGNSVPMLAAAASVLATSQSAATFLGGPEYAYRSNLTFVGFYVSALLAVLFIAKVLVPRFYAIRAVTVYELLERRYGATAKREAGVMFLVGRVLASGARLYIGALAVSMIVFADIAPLHLFAAILMLVLGALAYTYFGGVKSVIYSDVIQAVTYIGAGVAVLIYLYSTLQTDFGTMYDVLNAEGKLTLIDTAGNFGIWSLLGGWLLLNIAAYGLDQDMTQRVLACKNGRDGSRALVVSIVMTIPVVLLFLAIGLLLYLFYNHPELSGIGGGAVQEFGGEKITIFMTYILNEMPAGLRGFVTVGAIAAALSSTNSVLAAMASVAVEDIYRPWKTARGVTAESHYVAAARAAVLLFALVLTMMAVVSYYWQRATDLPLVSFALGVMSFAYAGLLGVYASALFTKRGSARAVPWALGGGFVTVLLLQPYCFGGAFSLADQLVGGTAVAFVIMQLGTEEKAVG
ncbi:sodium:solute symporter [Sulfurimonas sp. HSL-3221]|uniref:sodium:solute symporter n=1 Tax=Sulfurimonadaceae TaxID=2771471 RepID=UPI001E5CFBE7|nr:sodium:solute symporter [Sulfurimonas sp. HSL-3221]UFS61791.1 sodium:solute symporter [Sulfurimonas sp. HSL-3221]